jgi:hypothetical protein
MKINAWIHIVCIALFLLSGPEVGRAGTRLEQIQTRGTLLCGVASNDPGFSVAKPDGTYSGLEVDMCRAIASAIFGSAHYARFQSVETVHDFLEDPHIDIVFHRLTWTLTREAPGQLEFGPVYFHERNRSGRLEPVAPLLRDESKEFSRIVRWTIFALIDAEDKGLGSTNVDQKASRMNWAPPSTGEALGLDAGWARNLVKEVGNYGEIVKRHRHSTPTLQRPRGPNRTVRSGGLLWAPGLS